MMIDKELLMSYLYGELSEEEKQRVEEALALSPDLQAELEELQGIRSIMSEWKDELPHTPLKYARKPKLISYSWFAAGIAASFLVLAFLSLLVGAEVKYSQEHGLSLTIGKPKEQYINREELQASLDSITRKSATETSSMPLKDAPVSYTSNEKTSTNLSPSDMQQLINKVNEQNNKNLQAVLALVQQNQEKQLDITLKVFANYLEQQRKSDIQTISTEMEKMKRNADSKFYETDLAINKLFQTVQYTGK